MTDLDTMNDHSKRFLQTRMARIGQAVNRHGHPFLAVGAFERVRGTDDLHLHALLHLRKGGERWLDSYIDGTIAKLIPALPHHIGYVGKQRRQLSPAFERTSNLWCRQPGGLIPGRRLYVSNELKALVPHSLPRHHRCEHDWCAYRDGEEERGQYGWGRTEQDAIRDLLMNVEDNQ